MSVIRDLCNCESEGFQGFQGFRGFRSHELSRVELNLEPRA